MNSSDNLSESQTSIVEMFRQEIQNIFNNVFTQTTVPTVSKTHQIYEQALIRSLQVLKANAGCIAFLDRGINDFEVIIAHGYGKDFLWWKHVNYGEGIVSQVAQTGNAHFSADVTKEAEYKSLCKSTASQITIPLYSSSGLLSHSGVFAVMSFEFFCSVTEEIFALAKELAKDIELFLSRFRTDLLTLRTDKLYKLANNIAEKDDYEEMIDSILAAAKSFVDSSEVALLVRFGGRLIVQSRQDFTEKPPDNLEIGISEGKGYTCYVAQTRKSFYLANVSDTERYPYYLKVVPDTRSQYSVPIIYRKDLVGVLNIGSRIEYGFSQDDRTLIDFFASMVSNAVYNSKLIKELRTISHQVNQKLNNVNFLESSIVKRLESNQEVVDSFRILQNSINEAKHLVAQSTYPMRPEKLEEIDVHDSLSLITEKIKTLIYREDIDLLCELSSDTLPKIKVSIRHFEDVINNVVWNAVEATRISDIKKITVATEIKVFNESKFICIAVADTGKGISQEQIDKAFEPGYYKFAKRSGSFGRGMGLWVCDQVLSNYGGFMELKKNIPSGTRAIIYFPTTK